MLQIKDHVVIHEAHWSADLWRRKRAYSLARMIAWRSDAHPDGRARIKRIILEDIVPDIGWPKLGWLKRHVRKARAEIRANLMEWSSRTHGDNHG